MFDGKGVGMTLEFTTETAAQWRGAVFFGLAAAFIAAESLFPDRPRVLSRRQRWPGNVVLVLIGGFIARFLPVGALAGAALFAQAQGIGLFHWLDAAGPGTPVWVQWLVSLVVLDFAVWAFHLAAHRVQGLWVFHRVHHADPDIDVTTALRFHPGEIALSSLYKAGFVIALGAPVLAAVLFEMILNGLAMFNHANWRIPPAIDRVLRLFVVTPAFHRMHHAMETRHNRNFGFCLSLWDRLFGQAVVPTEDRAALQIGLPEYRPPAHHSPLALLAQPFRAPPPAGNPPPAP